MSFLQDGKFSHSSPCGLPGKLRYTLVDQKWFSEKNAFTALQVCVKIKLKLIYIAQHLSWNSFQVFSSMIDVPAAFVKRPPSR
jgi:hypothetical protein